MPSSNFSPSFFQTVTAPHSTGSSPLPTTEALAPIIFKEVIKLAVEQHGFKEKPSMASGRATNVLIAPHSAAGLYFGDAAVKHAGERLCLSLVP